MVAALDAGAGPEIVTWPMLLAGLGIGALASQLGAVTVSSVPDEQSGEVGGLQNTVTNLGASIGTALAGAVLISALTASFLAGLAEQPGGARRASPSRHRSSWPAASRSSPTPTSMRRSRTRGVPPAGRVADRRDSYSEARLVGLRAAMSVLAVFARRGARVHTEDPDEAGWRAPRDRGDSVTDLCSLGAAELVAMMRVREISSREVVSAFLARIDALNPSFNAIVSRRPDSDVLAEADEADRALLAGADLGLLHGLPHAIKDTANTAGLRSTYGSPLFADHVPNEDGLAVGRVRRGGAIIIGKTNVPEFGLGSHTYNPIFGATGNAWEPGLQRRGFERRRGRCGRAAHAADGRRQRSGRLAAEPRWLEQRLRAAPVTRAGAVVASERRLLRPARHRRAHRTERR